MSNQIFRSICIVAISVFLASLIFVMGISYDYLSAIQKRQLKAETELAAQGVLRAGTLF